MLSQQLACLQVRNNKSNKFKIKKIIFYKACRQQSCPRTFKEISAVSNNGTTIKDIGRCYKIIRKTLDPIALKVESYLVSIKQLMYYLKEIEMVNRVEYFIF